MSARSAKTGTIYDSDGPLPAEVSVDGGTVSVKLKVHSTDDDLGIMTMPKESGRGMVVSQITPNSCAARSEAIHVGDLLLSVNGKGVLNSSHEAVRLALEVCGNVVVLELSSEYADRVQTTQPYPKRKTSSFKRMLQALGTAPASHLHRLIG